MKKQKNHLPIPLVVGVIVGTLAGLVYVNIDDPRTTETAVLLAEETTHDSATTGTSSDTQNSGNNDEISRAQENLRWDKENYKNRSNEIKNNFRNTKADISDLNNKMATWSDYLNRMEAAINSGDTTTFWDLNSQEDDLNQDINDGFNYAYAATSFEGSKENALSNKPRELKDLERQLKDLKRNSTTVDTSSFDTAILQMTDLITRMQTFANTSTTGFISDDLIDLNDNLSDVIRDFEDLANDFRNNINDLNQVVNDQNQITNATKGLKDKSRTIKDIERQYNTYVKQLGADKVTELGTALQTMRDIYSQVESAIAANDVETINYIDQDFWSANTEAWDIINALNEVGSQESLKKDAERILKEKERQIGDMRRECKRVECENTESGGRLNELDPLLQRMRDVSATGDNEGFWDLNGQFDDISREFWDGVSHQSNAKDLVRRLKDESRQIKDHGRWVADLERQAKNDDAIYSSEEVAQLQSIYERRVELLKRANDLNAAGDTEGANDILNNDYNDARMEFDEITTDFNTRQQHDFMRFELSNIEHEIESARKRLDQSSDLDQGRRDLCGGYIEEAQKLLLQLQAIQEEGKMDSQEELMIRFENIGNDSDRDCGDIFGPSEDNHKSYVDYYIEDDYQNLADQIFAKVSEKILDNIMSKYQSTLNSMLEQAGQRWENELKNFMQSSMAVYDITAKDSVESLMNQKARLLEQVQELENKVTRKTAEFNALQERLAGYNFYGNAGEEIQSELEKFASESEGLTDAQRDARIRELKSKAEQAQNTSREEKFRDGIIPFRDTDDNEWFTSFVASLSSEGIVGGYKDANGNLTGQFGPADPVLVSQVLKMALESAGLGQADGEPELRQARDSWARGYVKQAENLRLSIVSGLDNLDRKATRGEVVRVILEVAGVRPADVRQSSFSDVSSSDPNMPFIEAAKESNIISGDSGSNTFRPNDSINRAEVSKIISNALTYLFREDSQSSSETEDFGDDGEYNPGFRYEEGMEPEFVEET